MSVGGNALIVRDHRMRSINRCISISMEVLRVDWSRSGDVHRDMPVALSHSCDLSGNVTASPMRWLQDRRFHIASV